MQQHVVGFDIADARNLVTEDGNPCDPFVVVTCCGRRVETKVKEEKLSQVLWNESHKWADMELMEEDFRSATIEFAVYARNFFSRNYLIGKATLQLLQINRRKGHVLANRAVPLRREGSAQTTGVLNLTVFCLRPGESVPNWGSEGAHDNDRDEKDLLDIRAAVLGARDVAAVEQGNPYHLLVNIFRVEGLARMYGQHPNPFVTVEFAGTVVRTRTAWGVENFAWNECVRFPVLPPIYEDTVVLKLWSAGTSLTADQLLAKGFLNFSELRNSPMGARWFNLYGWNPEEVPDVAAARQSGEGMKANFFIGRLLVGARVAAVESMDQLQPAGLDLARARTAVEPGMESVTLLADVYEVSGAVGRECRVEVQFGQYATGTPEWVTPSAGSRVAAAHPVAGLSPSAGRDVVWDVGLSPGLRELSEAERGDVYRQDSWQGGLQDRFATFFFDEAEGRMDPLVAMCPHDPDSQPDVIINVYTRGVLSSDRRIAFARLRLSDFAEVQHQQDSARAGPRAPAHPRYVPLEPIPGVASQRVPPAVLMTLERRATDAVARAPRMIVHPTRYCVRAYVFMARNVQAAGETGLAVRVSCAGSSKSTLLQRGPRPVWMSPVELKVTLQSDHPLQSSELYMEPIHLALVDEQGANLGKAVCRHEQPRRKGAPGEAPSQLDPRWVDLQGGSYGGRVVGQVLVAFELIKQNALADARVQPLAMWPPPQDPRRASLAAGAPSAERPLCRLRKATLHFALHGLRDLVMKNGALPEVIVRVKSFQPQDHDSQNEEKKGSKPGRSYVMRFRRADSEEADERQKQLLEWRSDALGHADCGNFEVLEVKRMRIALPDHPIFEPCVSVEVRERPVAGLFGTPAPGGEGPLIGEHRRDLSKLLPCNWYDGVTMNRAFHKQEAHIQRAIAGTHRDDCKESPRERRQKAPRRAGVGAPPPILKRSSASLATLADTDFGRSAVDSSGLPAQLRYRPRRSGVGGGGEASMASHVREPIAMNMKRKKGFKPMLGAEPQATATSELARHVVHARLEQPGKDGSKAWTPDFAFRSQPLLRGCDALHDEEAEGTDWNFEHGRCFGFVKYALKLTDGWDDDDSSEDEDLELGVQSPFSYPPLTGRSTHVGSACSPSSMPGSAAPSDFLAKARTSCSPSSTRVAAGGFPGKAKAAPREAISSGSPSVMRAAWRDAPVSRVSATTSYTVSPEDRRRLSTSYGVDETLEKSIFDPEIGCRDATDLFFERYKSKKNLPSRVRVRIYLMRAVCLYSERVVNPFLSYRLGQGVDVSMRSMAQLNTSTPGFYRVEERDIQLPQEGRLQLNLNHMVDGALMGGDPLIGSTVVDLEDRWHSGKLSQATIRKQVPIEHRPLVVPGAAGRSRGSVEMRIELLDSVKASDEPPAQLPRPVPTELEVRFVIRSTTGVKIVDGEHTDVKVIVELECDEYLADEGYYPKSQPTDVHYRSTTGDAVFNWRAVFPRIAAKPTTGCNVCFKVYDANNIVGDTYIGEVTIDIRKHLAKVARDLDMLVIEKGELAFRDSSSAVGDGKDEAADVGKVQFEMYVLTQAEATLKLAGVGRDEPNAYPQLAAPVDGRLWGDVLAPLIFEWPKLGLFGQAVPIVLFALLCLVLLKWADLV